MNITIKNTLLGLGVLLLAFVLFSQATQNVGAALPNFHSRLATQATTTVGADTDVTLFSERELCSSRIITTRSEPIQISFSSSFNPSARDGHEQLASTTVAYDAELYGCGIVKAMARASSTITVSEFSF